MHIRDAFAEFLVACQADGFSPATVKWYRERLSKGPYNVIDWLSARGRWEIEAISTSMLRDYIAWLRDQKNVRTGKPHSVYTTNGVIRCLHRFFRFCSEEFHIANAMERIKYPKNPDPEPRAIKLETAVAMIASCGDDIYGIRNRALMMMLLSTGARRAGLATLAVDRLYLQQRYAVVIEKGSRSRVVPFDELTAVALNDWMYAREPLPYLFYNIRTEQPLTSDGIRIIFRKIADKHGITGKVNPHGWRHLFAELFHRAGGQIASLSKIMGHKSTAVTANIYLNFAMQTALDDYERLNPMQAVKEELKNQKPKTGGSGF
jgi:site-specific recombinase XerD